MLDSSPQFRTALIVAALLSACGEPSQPALSLPASSQTPAALGALGLDRLEVSLESQHPYPNGVDVRRTLRPSESASHVAIYFDRCELERGYDFLELLDDEDQVLDRRTGRCRGWTNWFESGSVTLRLVTDASVRRYGYQVSAIAYLEAEPAPEPEPDHGDVLEGDACDRDRDCVEGLICAGASAGYGYCTPESMRGVFGSEHAVAIPDNDPAGVVIPIEVEGLATVSTDVYLEIEVEHSWRGDLLVTLENPDTTVGTVFAGTPNDSAENLRFAGHITAFPGDESANGRWLLRVTDRAAQDVGRITSHRLTVTSRYD